MTVQQLRYKVTIGGTEHEVEVRWPDQVLAEREGPRHGITKESPLQLTDYWLWAAMKRTGRYPGDFQSFTQDPDRDVEPIEDTAPVDPTQPAASSVPVST